MACVNYLLIGANGYLLKTLIKMMLSVKINVEYVMGNLDKSIKSTKSNVLIFRRTY